MKLGDLDISPVSVARPGRAVKSGAVAEKDSRGNPLYRPSRSSKLYQMQGDGEGSGVSSSVSGSSWEGKEESEDLDGHTLSCSLELMSDLGGEFRVWAR